MYARAVWCLLVTTLVVAGKDAERHWQDGVVVAIEGGFIQTGTVQSGQSDERPDGSGTYSSRTRATGFNAIDYVIRTKDTIITLRLNTTPTAARLHPLAGAFAKPKSPIVAVKDKVRFDVERNTAWLEDSAGKQFKLTVLRTGAVAPLGPAQQPNAVIAGADARQPSTTALPDEARKAIGVYLGNHLLNWTDEDARTILGDPLVHRYAYDQMKSVVGDIYRYVDPTGEYQQIELNFDSKTRRMVGIFLYPQNMTWDDCRKLWGDQVRITKNEDGTVFHDYTNRRLNVLLDSGGRVISLGLY